MRGVERPARDRPSKPPVDAGEAKRTVEVVYALPERQWSVVVELPPEGLVARQAVERSGLLQALPALAAQPLVLGIFGTVCEDSRALRDGDRVEIYRPLKHDPRAMRRERAASATRRSRRR